MAHGIVNLMVYDMVDSMTDSTVDDMIYRMV